MSRGYPGGRVYGITQTRDGYLWIGTDRGLIRFDGFAFHVFQEIEPAHVTIDSVFALAGDSRGNLVISTLLGVQRLRLQNEELNELTRLPGQPADPVSAIYRDQAGSVLVATVRRGIIAYDGEKFAPVQDTLSDITAAVCSRDGTLWMGTATQGLFGYRNREGVHEAKDLQRFKINALLPDGQHGLWVGTEEGLLRWDGMHPPVRVSGPSHIRVMLADRQGDVWLASSKGLFRMDSDGPHELISQYSNEIVTSLYEDREGDIWAGTSTGIVRLRKRVLSTYTIDPDPEGSGGALFADDRGSVWCARSRLGLVRIFEGRVQLVRTGSGYTSLAGAGRDLWLGQKDGTLLRVRTPVSSASVTVTREAQLGQPVISIFKSREGYLWAGMQNGGVAKIEDGRTVLYSSVDSAPLNTVTAIEQTRDGSMWFASVNGVAGFSSSGWHRYTARDGMPPGRINCILADPSGILWVGADQGLAYIEKGIVQIPASNPSLLHEPIFGIAVDREGFLWIVTSSHLFRVRRDEFFKDDARPVVVRRFSADDGLPPVSPSRTSRCIVSDVKGRIWLSLGNRVVMADPLGLSQPSAPTLVQLQRISADEVPLSLQRNTVYVPPNHVRTVIRFAGLNLATPDRVRFRYRLEGLDRKWGATTPAREATYTNLAPGPYRFKVQAATVEGLWNAPPAEIELYIEPAAWQTLWFRFLAALVLCAMAFAGYQWRLRALKGQWSGRFQERLDERNRIARDLHDTLLQSFQGLILRFQAVRDMLPDRPDAAYDALGSAIDRAAAAVTEGRDAVQALRGEDDYNELGESLAAVDRELRDEISAHRQTELQPSYRVLVEGTPRRLHPVVRDDLYRIAREAVRNALRHAYARNIELDIRYDKEVLRLRVRDDGDGIGSTVLSSGRRKGHYGLPGMRERTTSIGGQFEIWSELRRGTEIEVTIPGALAYVQVEGSGKAVYTDSDEIIQ